MTSPQHRQLLAVRDHNDPRGPTTGDVAGFLVLRHHSADELTQRAEHAGIIRRVPDLDNGRVVLLALSPNGRSALRPLTTLHLQKLDRMAEDLRPLQEGLDSKRAMTRTNR